jgi:hypothetical protein
VWGDGEQGEERRRSLVGSGYSSRWRMPTGEAIWLSNGVERCVSLGLQGQ